MKQHSPQFVTDNSGKKVSVIIPLKDYERMLEQLEDLQDVRMYDAVKERNEESIPFDEYLKQRKKRKHA